VAINFSREIGWSGSIMLELQRDGESSVTETFVDGTPQLGTWATRFSAERFDALLSTLHASGYDKLPDVTAALRPGAKVIALGERHAGAQYPLLKVYLTTPAELTETLRTIESLRAELHQHPQRVLRGAASWLSPARELRRGEEIKLTLQLSNAGTQSLETGNPFRETPPSWNGLRLVLSSPSKSDESIDLTPAHVQPNPGIERGAVINLAPDHSVEAQLHVPVDVSSGSYQLALQVHTLVESDVNQQLVTGMLSIPLGQLTVQRDKIWKVWR
jgi:hypothetical protein